MTLIDATMFGDIFLAIVVISIVIPIKIIKIWRKTNETRIDY